MASNNYTRINTSVTVAVPTNCPGKIVLKKQYSSTYVFFEYGRVYNKATQHTTPLRAIIGKLADDPQKMHPNDNFSKYFPDVALPEISNTPRSDSIKFGTYSCIKVVAEKYKLPKHLERIFGREEAGQILDLAAYMITSESNAVQHYPGYVYNHALFTKDMKRYSDSTVCRLFQSISDSQIRKFLDLWNKDRNHDENIYLSYDSTNMNCEAGDVNLVELGHAKEDKSVPIYNLAIGFDTTNKIPLFYEAYEGSMNDVTIFREAVFLVQEFGYSIVTFILDRGYFSRENLNLLDRNGYDFIIMCKGNKDLVNTLVRVAKPEFEYDSRCNIEKYHVMGITKQGKLFNEEDEPIRYFHIYYSIEKAAKEKADFDLSLRKHEKMLALRLGHVYEDGHAKLDKYYDFWRNNDGLLTGYTRNIARINAEYEVMGCFCIITSQEMDAAQAIQLYKGRDSSENLFKFSKTFLGTKTIRVHTEESIKGKTFIQFIALIIRNGMYNRLQDKAQSIMKNVNYLTVPAAIDLLEEIEMTRYSGTTYSFKKPLTAKQKVVLSAFSMNSSSMSSAALRINDILQYDSETIADLLVDSDDQAS